MLLELIGISIVLTILFYYIKEQKNVIKARNSIPIRIHVNGIRGKTSVTRMIGSLMRPYYTTITKTTGSEPKLIYPDGEEELIIRESSVNIKENMDIIQKAYNIKAECIVMECMAIEPALQKVLEENVMKSTIGVITNIRYDHEEVMGESLEEIAISLSNTIPTNSKLVLLNDIQCIDILERIAKEKNTVIYYAYANDVPIGYAQKFKFMNFNENIALVLKVAEIMNIDREMALKNILDTKHDVGKGAIFTRMVDNKIIHFINAFANNDIQSLTKMLSTVNFSSKSKKIALLSHRDDRIRRTISMIDFITKYGFDAVLISSNSNKIEKELRSNGYKGNVITKTDGFIEELQKISDKKETYWIGIANIKTKMAESVMSYFGAL